MTRIGSNTSLATAAVSGELSGTEGGAPRGALNSVPEMPATGTEGPVVPSSASMLAPTAKPLMMFKGCPLPLGATILLKASTPLPPCLICGGYHCLHVTMYCGSRGADTIECRHSIIHGYVELSHLLREEVGVCIGYNPIEIKTFRMCTPAAAFNISSVIKEVEYIYYRGLS